VNNLKKEILKIILVIKASKKNKTYGHDGVPDMIPAIWES
jgi:hypothetical protein